MSRQMIVNARASEEIRVAIIENKRLLDLDIENISRAKQKGNVYKGIVANVEDSLEAAFIEFGEDKQGFLALSEIRPALFPEGTRKKRPKISQVLQRGQEIVVQVTKDEIGNKGAAVTTYLSLPGRYVVLMHSDDGGGGISRKIEDEKARRNARSMLAALEMPDGVAVIIRTAGMHRPQDDLLRDLEALSAQWEQIDRGAQLGRAPTLLYREPDLVVRTIRDYLSPKISKIIIDSEEEFEEVKSYFEIRMPDAVDLIERHEDTRPVFEKYGIERAIEELFQRTVKLPSGGELVIDQTEALVAVDVNSSRSTKEGDHEATVYKTNLEAAKELARQLRLRDLGGIILIDFIDMAMKKHERDVERALRDAMRHDKARVKLGRISDNGTLELTRQRLRQAHRLISFTTCPTCDGTGSVRDPDGLATSALRQLQNRLAKSRTSLARMVVRLPVPVANVLANRKRRELVNLSDDQQVEIDVVGDARLNGNEIKFEEERRGRAGLDAAKSVRDPRLDGSRRRRRRNEDLTPKQTVPPPSIGTVPRVIPEEERAQLPEYEERKKSAPAEKTAVEPQHFDDPLTEALFGTAPEYAIEDIEAPVPEGRRRKKRRRRSRKRPGDDEQRAEKSAKVDDESVAAKADGSEEPKAVETSAPEVKAEPTADDAVERPRKKRARRPRVAKAANPKNDEVKVDEVKADDAAKANGEAKADVKAGGEAKAPPKRATKKRVTKKRTTKARAKKAEEPTDNVVDLAAGDDAAQPSDAR